MKKKHMKNIASALRTIETEISGLIALKTVLEGPLASSFEDACSTIKHVKGRVIVTGMGKSGHVSSKLAASLASTGTPAFFVHPAEANHGDLGMIARDDVIIAMSWSGEAAELKGILAYASRFSIPLIAITRNKESALGKVSDICLELPIVEEACPNGLAPTTSTIMQMALGDALAVALLESRGFSADDFGIYHPGGSLGAALIMVKDIMHTGKAIPIVRENTSLPDAIAELSKKQFGCVAIVDEENNLCGIFTDGDLARNLDKDLTSLQVDELMTKKPVTVAPELIANSALAILDQRNINALIITENNKPVGILHLQDLLRLGVA